VPFSFLYFRALRVSKRFDRSSPFPSLESLTWRRGSWPYALLFSPPSFSLALPSREGLKSLFELFCYAVSFPRRPFFDLFLLPTDRLGSWLCRFPPRVDYLGLTGLRAGFDPDESLSSSCLPPFPSPEKNGLSPCPCVRRTRVRSSLSLNIFFVFLDIGCLRVRRYLRAR